MPLLQRAVETRAPIAQSVGVTWLDDALGAVSAAWLGSAQPSHPLLATRAGLPHWKRMRRRARSTAWADDVQPRVQGRAACSAQRRIGRCIGAHAGRHASTQVLAQLSSHGVLDSTMVLCIVRHLSRNRPKWEWA